MTIDPPEEPLVPERGSTVDHTFAIGEDDFLLDGEPFVIRGSGATASRCAEPWA